MQNLPNIVRDRLKMATPAGHPDADTLNAFSERLLPEAERAVVLQHLAQCVECREVVALALPETETLQPVLGTAASRWLAWPTMRWAFVAAGVVIVSVGLVEYKHREAANAPMARMALKEQQEQVNSAQTLPAVTTPQPGRDQVKVTNALVAKSEAQPAVPGTANAPTSVSRTKQFHGSAYGAAPGGPLSPNQVLPQWQQNANQNQAGATASAFGNAVPRAARQAAPSTSPQADSFNTQLAKNQPRPALGANGAGFAVDKAKLPVPPPGVPVNGKLNRQFTQGGGVEKLGPQASPGQIGGYVVDPSGAVVSNAHITITPSQTGDNVTAVTNAQGAWLIAGLPSGTYRAEAEAPGFKTTILDLNYDANQPSMFSFTLSPGNVSEAVEVSSAQMQPQTQGAAIADNEMKPAANAFPAGADRLEQYAKLQQSPAPLPRWSVSSGGMLQRSFDQGNTWQFVSVGGALVASARRDLDISGDTQSVKEGKAARAKARSAGKKDDFSPLFRAVIANGSDVWAGGRNASLYHSTDAGGHWVQVLPSSAGSVLTGDIVSIAFPDPQHGKLSTSTGETWTTADSGQSWQKQ